MFNQLHRFIERNIRSRLKSSIHNRTFGPQRNHRLRAGYRKDCATNAVAVPIYQTTSYQFDSTDHASDLFALKEMGNIHTRIMNPMSDVLEKRLAAMEGGVASLAVSSGQSASMMAVQNAARAGDNIVSSTGLYGGTWNLFANQLGQIGIECRFADPEDPENFRKAADDKTRAHYAETLPTPSFRRKSKRPPA